MPRPHTRAPGDAEPNIERHPDEPRTGGQGRCRSFARLQQPAQVFSIYCTVYLSLALSSRAHALLSQAARLQVGPLLGRGDRWHSTDRCHSALLSSKPIFQGGRGALQVTYPTKSPTRPANLPWPCNAAAVPRPQIWGRCNCHDLYPVYGSCMQRCVRVVCCSTSVPLLYPPAAVPLLLATSASDDARKCRRQAREPQSLFKPPASRTCPVRHSARPPRPSDNGDLHAVCHIPTLAPGATSWTIPIPPLGLSFRVVDGPQTGAR